MHSPVPTGHRLARAALTVLAEPADPVLGAFVRLTDPAAVLHCIDTGRAPAGIAAALGYLDSDLARMLNRWRHRIGEIPDATDLARYERDGIRLLCPGDREWPSALYDLDDTCPYALWLRGDLDLGACSEKSAAIAGSRAVTGYGAHVAGQLATDLAGQGWAIVSGAAYGIDAAAHRGALTVMDRGADDRSPGQRGEPLLPGRASRPADHHRRVRPGHQRVTTRPRTHPGPVHGQEQDHCGAQRRNRDRRGGPAQRCDEHRRACVQPGQAADGSTGPGDLSAVQRMPRADPDPPRDPGHRQRGRPGRGISRGGLDSGLPGTRRSHPVIEEAVR
jgi:DNA recombination-mediator protein A